LGKGDWTSRNPSPTEPGDASGEVGQKKTRQRVSPSPKGHPAEKEGKKLILRGERGVGTT